MRLLAGSRQISDWALFRQQGGILKAREGADLDDGSQLERQLGAAKEDLNG